jgi:hypothetical protein
MADHDTEPGGVLMPDARAPHSEWMAYAVDQGMPEDLARGLTRDQIRVNLGAESIPLGGEPSLDVLERDPETRAARRAAQRPAWER